MDWVLMGTFLLLMAPSCQIADSLLSKKEKGQDEYTIIKWFAYLDDFTYSEAICQANIFCNRLLDKFYGKDQFSLRCFGFSCFVSLLTVSILTVVVIACGIINPGEYKSRIFEILVLAVLLNIWVDYISLIETRLVLRYASRVKPIMLPILLLADLFLCAVIYLLFAECVGSALCLLGLESDVSASNKGYLAELINVAFVWSHDNADANVAFYSTFSTSLFFHLYCLSAVFFKVVKLSKTRLMTWLERLEDSGHLCKALGGWIAALSAIAIVVVTIVRHLAGN